MNWERARGGFGLRGADHLTEPGRAAPRRVRSAGLRNNTDMTATLILLRHGESTWTR